MRRVLPLIALNPPDPLTALLVIPFHSLRFETRPMTTKHAPNHLRTLTIACALGLMAVGSAMAADPQIDAAADPAGLRQELDTLRQGQDAMAQELKEIKQLLQGRARQQAAMMPRVQPTDQVLSIAGAATKGRDDAQLTLVEFSDYQCPVCRRHFEATMPMLDKDYVETGKLRYVFRDFPLDSMHQHAFAAAEAAHCAGDQGKYWQMHDRLFSDRLPPERKNLDSFAGAIGLDPAAFKTCMDSGKYTALVRESQQDGQQLGVRGTPSFYIGALGPNGKVKAIRVFRGAMTYPMLKKTLDELLEPKS